ncbi:alpha/beta hydrolase [Pseudoalteromonas sp. PS5]|uniref:alpha/beta fold hydrolase n=1 Tax=Pseudoalteromonas sp. PS5 TaxID=1437473 RepID=UPI000FFF66F1|nr:alpha/beta hydrolase [Pseudoalteromonas sp. PS5]RXF00835.1 alpha/beta hydrolase [Pseudoalteromonas sp. PS5]
MCHKLLFLFCIVASSTAFAKAVLERTIKERIVVANTVSLQVYHVAGSDPAIVFETGSAAPAIYWTLVLKGLSQRVPNTLLAYNREGYGKSELSHRAYSVDTDNRNLQQLLKALNISTPFIYVGHSYAYYVMQNYITYYPEQIAALLYVDPVTVYFIDKTQALTPDKLLPPLDTLPDNVLARALRRETQALSETVASVRPHQMPKNVPCRVIAAQYAFDPNKRDLKAWREGQNMLASHCNSQLIIAQNSDHTVPMKAPQIVIEQVIQLVQELTPKKGL